MSKANSHAYALERQRDSIKRTRQVWVGLLIVWAVVVGWVIFGFVNSFSDDVNAWLSWSLAWLVPVAILAAGSIVTQLRLKACEQKLLHVAD